MKRTYRYDDDFDGERLVDVVSPVGIETQRKMVVYSPKLRANIMVWKSRLHEVMK